MEDKDDSSNEVLVKLVSLQPRREIGYADNLTASLSQRLPEIRNAIQAGIESVAASLHFAPRADGWRATEVEAAFGISLTAEGGALIAKAGAGATLDLAVTFTRESDD